MNYELIAQKVEEIIKEKADYIKVPKGKHLLNCIVIGNGNVRPTLYIKDFENHFETEEEIANAIAERYKSTPKFELSDLPTFDFENLKQKIIPCVVNKGAFADKSVITRNFIDDIEICYRICLDIDKADGVSHILVKKDILKQWDISVDDLHKLAINNLCEKPYSFEDMAKTIIALSNHDEETQEMITEQNSNMYILSNDTNIYGASNLLNKKVLSEIQTKIGDYFIIPSSIHELILLPCDTVDDVSAISRMIREVNDTHVSEDEILSYSVFCFKAESGLSQVA